VDIFLKFFRLVKVDEPKRMVYGLVTAEREDRDGETCHYATTKTQYESVNAEMGKASDGDNIMPLREMHQLNAVGAGKEIAFDDAQKSIRMGFKVVDDSAWKKVLEKVLLGFSQGGRYLKRWTENGVNYYTAQPGEVSLVDNPCLPGAFIEYVKADGHVELFKTPESKLSDDDIDRLVKALLSKSAKTKRVAGEDLTSSAFAYVGDADDPSTWKLPIKFSTEEKTKSHIRNALARFSHTDLPEGAKSKALARIRAAAKEHGIDVTTEAKKIFAVWEYLHADALGKGMYTVAQVAQVLDTLNWIVRDLACEREIEGDASTAPDDLNTVLEDLVTFFVELVAEETGEILAAPGLARKIAMNPEQIKKCAAALGISEEDFKKQFVEADALAKAKKGLTALHGHLQKAVEHHAKMSEAHEKLGAMHKAHAEHLAKCMKAAKDVMGDGEDADKALKTLLDELGAPAPAPAPAPAAAATEEKFSKAEVQKMIDEALAKAPAPDPKGLRIVPRDDAASIQKANDTMDPFGGARASA
jgi:hypothetical protein